MKVSKNSWHMRAARKVWGQFYTPDNLCKHFWVVMSVLSLWAVIAGMCLFAVGSVGLVVYKIVDAWTWLATWISVAIVSAAAVFIGMWYLTARFLHPLYLDVKEERMARPPKPVKEPGFLHSWFKAKKGRYCPLIEVTDDDEWVSLIYYRGEDVS